MTGRKPRPDLLDELMPAPAAEAAAERPHPLPAGPKPSRGGEDSGERRRPGLGGGRAVPAGPRPTHRHLGPGYVEDAIRERLERDRAELNQSGDFPPVTDHLRPGRRIGG